MKIIAFRAFQRGAISIEDVLRHLLGLPLDQRLRDFSGMPMRLEAGRNEDDLWLLDFASIRPDGPGRASADAPIQDFEMGEADGFGHETAACFDGEFLVLQYNHYGPRISRIKEYLSKYGREIAGGGDPDQVFAVSPVLKDDARARLGRMGLVKSIDLAFYVPGVIEAEGVGRRSLGGLLDSPLIGTTDKIRVQFSASRDRASSLALNEVAQIVNDFVGLGESVSELRIVAKEDEDSPREAVDFLGARLEADIPVQRVGRRFGRDQRWAALKQSLQTWRDNGQLR